MATKDTDSTIATTRVAVASVNVGMALTSSVGEMIGKRIASTMAIANETRTERRGTKRKAAAAIATQARLSASSIVNSQYTTKARETLQSNIKVERKFPRMRPQPNGINFVLAFVFDPSINQILGEHVALQEKIMIQLQRVEHHVQ